MTEPHRPIAARRGRLQYTYASMGVAAEIPAFDISRFMGHAKVTNTLGIYAHLFADDHADAMAALGRWGAPRPPATSYLCGVGRDGQSERGLAAAISSDVGSLLGLRAALGRRLHGHRR
jgi:hypothetical protein